VAGRSRLNTGAGTRLLALLALLALVLLLHALALQWLAVQLEPPSALQPLAPPMFTRLLRPEAPPAAPAPPKQAAARARPSRPAVTAIPDPQSAPAPIRPASAPEAPAEPWPSETEVAAATPDTTSTPTVTTTVADTLAPPSAPASAPAPAPASPAPGTGLDGWPADTRLSYDLGGYFRGELHGSATVQWQRQDNRYQTRVDIDLTFLASLALTSQGDVTPQGLVPRVYEELRRRGPRTVRLGDDTITLNDGRKVPRLPGVQDAASQFVELSHRFASGQDVLEVGRSVSFWMARPGAVDLWTYDIVAKEMLQSPELGAFEAFHLKPRPIANPRGNITAEMWFAPTLKYLPVRIRVNMGDTAHVDLMVVKIEQR